MAEHLRMVFKADDMQRLLDRKPRKILVRTSIETDVNRDGKEVGVVKVYAEAIAGGKVLETIEGCPVPPCSEED